MKIFRNRGDIYIPKSGYKSSREERILISLLVLIVVFTIAFIVLLSQKYDSVAHFFAGNDFDVEQEEIIDDSSLVSISGKTNYLIMQTDDEESTIHFIFLLQADGDNLSYKISTLSPDMIIDNQSVTDIFETGGGASLQTRLGEYFGFEIDHYAQFTRSSFVEFAGDLGHFVYPCLSDIRFNDKTENDEYAIRINEGEQKLNGKDFSNLLRYFTSQTKNYTAANELIMYASTQFFSSSLTDKGELLFRHFISTCTTDITVRDFENGRDRLTVFCSKSNDITVYSSVAEYENNALSSSSIKNIKGYFSK